MKPLPLVLISTFLALLIACKSEDDTTIVMNNDFYKSYYADNIIPSLEQFRQELGLLKQFALEFKTSGSDADYQNLLGQWLASAKAYSRTEVYH